MRLRLLLLVSSFASALLFSRHAAAEDLVVPRFTHPGAGQTFYFVLTDRFANGRADNDHGGLPGGSEATGFDPARLSHYHGGDFAGLTAHLDYLRGLGVTAVWVTPPFKNKPMQAGTAGYHGYWITDFLTVDPHLGTEAEFREFIRQAHARGLRVTMDIIVNHTADVIAVPGDRRFQSRAASPLHDTRGRVVDESAIAWNGLTDARTFPKLSAKKSFAYPPSAARTEAKVKSPDWLNDVTLYHNRGDSTFEGESATLGDFAGLDDLMTEHPHVVNGFIDVFGNWLDYGVDAYRIDTTRHVNNEFWQAFAPAIRARARALGRPDFLQFGEVYNDAGDVPLLSNFSTHVPLDTTLDFGFFAAGARKFVAEGGSADDLAAFFERDDYYTDHDSNVHATTTFLGNHDAGRFGYFLQRANPAATPGQLADLARLGHGLMYFARGQPVLYYGDEQGMIGRGGGDMQAREDMFAARAPDFAQAALLATTRTGRDDKFDPAHPFYRLFSRLAALRRDHAALRTGAMLARATHDPNVAAFSRIERNERLEYVAVFNNSRTQRRSAAVPTSQPGGSRLQRIFDSTAPDEAAGPEATVDEAGRLGVTLEPLEFALWRARTPLGDATPVRLAFATPATGATVAITAKEIDGLVFPSRQELRVTIEGGDGVGEVTFTLARSSRPGQLDYLGTDDSAPYRVFWSPPNDLAPGETLAFTATHDDLRGHRSQATIADLHLAPTTAPLGIVDSHTPVITRPPADVRVKAGRKTTLSVTAGGTGPLEYRWLRDGVDVPGAAAATLELTASAETAGSYRALVHNLAGTAISPAATVSLSEP